MPHLNPAGWPRAIAAWPRRTLLLAGSAAVLAAGLGLGLGLSLGGGSSSTASGSGNGTGSSASGSGRTTGSTAALGAAGIPVATSSTRRCTAGDVDISPGPSVSSQGHTGIPLVVTNHASSACSLAGYASVTGYTSSGSEVGPAVALPSGFVGGIGPNGTPTPVVLAPGRSGSAMIEAQSEQSTPQNGGVVTVPHPSSSTTTTRPRPSCRDISQVKVVLPGDTATTTVSVNLVDCSAFLVHPFVSGTSGSGT